MVKNKGQMDNFDVFLVLLTDIFIYKQNEIFRKLQ